ncbi:Sas10/Utp3/C1D family-domain-containing protein [Xylariaceae sp. FL1272]|nr:Sas10/Utp3/C1D family-domain-containing protein [Xylariaceae sp. FL1272]
MDPTSILPALERLDDGVDDLEEALEPLIQNVSDVASKLPLLDKAKLFVLVTYSIESMLFSALRLNGVDAKEHPVFKELTRVRQYFEKIKNIEFPPAPTQKPEQRLHKEAAIRFIRSDLADDKEVHSKLTEMIAKEKAQASLRNAKIGEKRKVNDSAASESEESEDEDAEEPVPEAMPTQKAEKPKLETKGKKKKQRPRKKRQTTEIKREPKKERENKAKK